jgi:DNA polymerase I
MEKNEKRLIIIDSNAIIHRAYHALPPLKKNGELINAIYGFLLFFFKAMKEMKPDYIAATFDFPAPTFRHKEYKEYKATRQKADKELYEQIPKTKNLLENFGIQVFEKEGYEADDLIGTISYLAESKNPDIETIILTGDNDTLQLVDANTKVYAIRKGVKDTVLYDEKLTEEKYGGLKPGQLIDFKALRGDPSDNIPGVFGIGEKTAIELIKQFGTLEKVYKVLESGKSDKIKDSVKEKLSAKKENAFLSKKLSAIDKKVPIEFDIEKCSFKNLDKNTAVKSLQKYNFTSLIARIGEIFGEPEENIVKAPKRKSAAAKNGNNLRLI